MRCTNPHFTLDEKCEKLKLNAVSNNFDLVENDNATRWQREFATCRSFIMTRSTTCGESSFLWTRPRKHHSWELATESTQPSIELVERCVTPRTSFSGCTQTWRSLVIVTLKAVWYLLTTQAWKQACHLGLVIGCCTIRQRVLDCKYLSCKICFNVLNYLIVLFIFNLYCLVNKYQTARLCTLQIWETTFT